MGVTRRYGFHSIKRLIKVIIYYCEGTVIDAVTDEEVELGRRTAHDVKKNVN